VLLGKLYFNGKKKPHLFAHLYQMTSDITSIKAPVSTGKCYFMYVCTYIYVCMHVLTCNVCVCAFLVNTVYTFSKHICLPCFISCPFAWVFLEIR